MKKGINIWSFREGMPIAECIDLAKRAGFDGIELSLNEEGELGLGSTERELRGIAARAAEAGIEIAGLATGLYWSYWMTSDSAAQRAKAIDICKRQLAFAAVLGADTILVIPGAVGADFLPDAKPVDYERAYERALEAITGLSAYARDSGVTIGIENVWNKFLLSPLEMRAFLDAVGSAFVGAYFDVGNCRAFGYPEQWIRILGSRIKKVHVKDYRVQAGGLHGFVDLLAGDVDYPAVMSALRAVGYDDYVTAEMTPPYRHYAERLIFHTSAAMDAIMGRNGDA